MRGMNKAPFFKRRTILRYLGTAAVAVCPICIDIARAIAEETTPGSHSGPVEAGHWSYEGHGGPEHWGSLSADFKVCELGMEQTPIDLASAVRAELGKVDVAYRPMPLRIVNNGHTIQVNAEPGSQCAIAGEPYELVQFHFHHPSEHLLSGKAFDLECHFVHRSAGGNLAVFGVFVVPGADNPMLQPIFDAMPREEGPERKADVSIDPAGLLPQGAGYFRYMGSLTTPPCSEGLIWTVFKDPIEASPAQIRQFASLFPNNARPAQGRNHRLLLQSY
jgi:carbonic anhydrase